MRALMSVALAATLALAGWLASGIVTIRSVEMPARIGLAPSLLTLIVIGVPLLVLVALARPVTGSRAPVRRVLAVVAALLPVWLPWTPVPLPAALLIWTGPLGLAWWLACVAYASADVWPRLVTRNWIAPWLSQPNRAPLVAALLAGTALVAAAWHTAPQHPRGDEPDYLIITQSLLLDRDLQIENNHTRGDHASYHPGPLPPSYLQRGRNGAIYSVHAPGLSAMLVPGFAVAGSTGAIATLVLWSMAGAWLAWRSAWDVTGNATASWVAVLATVGAAPFFLHATAVFPDAPASVLALGVVWLLVRDAGATSIRTAVIAAVLLGLLPWMHTRYAIVSVGLGALVVWRLWSAAAWARLVAFVAPAAVMALAWFGFFLVVYGTPNPSAPYGAYTQMALAHLRPGLPGILFDQQFGLFASAPVLMLALLALRPSVRTQSPRAWTMAWPIAVLALCYTCAVAAYRMWWGGWSAPARFLVPLVLPLAPFVAVAWLSLRTRASRHVALVLLSASLALTVALVVVDHGALAYNLRDGRARWAIWASPLVDLVAGLPAAHRDAPAIVVRDVAVWLGALAALWGSWRVLEQRGWLKPVVAYVTLAAMVPAALATLWTVRRVDGLAPAESQVRYLERQAIAASDVLVAISPVPRGRTRTWFEIELEPSHVAFRSRDDGWLFDRLPAGRYRLFSSVNAPGARLGVTVGEGRARRFLVELAPSASESSVASVPFELPLPVTDLVVRASREASAAPGRVWIQADAISLPVDVARATRAGDIGDDVWLLPETGIYPESGGAWLAGDAEVTVALSSSVPRQVSLRAGHAPVTVEWHGATRGNARLAAGETRVVDMAPASGRLRLRTTGGFRPSESTESSDNRLLGVWLSAAPTAPTAPTAP